MKVCGFTFVRNAQKYGYPIKESILSILPLCNKFIVVHGNSEDNTKEILLSIDSNKIEIIDSIWDDSLRKGGEVLALETNKAINAIGTEYDWAFYIQADEVVHEKYHEAINHAMQKYLNTPIDGLLFKYLHFYGTYNYIGDSRNWYRNEIRIIKNNKEIQSYKDAQGFRKNNQKLRVKPINAYIYHYGWVKDPATMKEKEKYFNKLWHSDSWIEKNVEKEDVFDFSKIDSLQKFNETHPAVMNHRIKEHNWDVDLNYKKKKFTIKGKILYLIEKFTGVRLFEYTNYKKV